MNWLDDELRTLFRRKQPPEGFAERVLARMETANAKPRQRRVDPLRQSWVRWVAVVATACLLLAIGLVQHQRHQRLRAEADWASQQATMALRIASTQLNMALEQAQQVTEQALTVKSKKRMERL